MVVFALSVWAIDAKRTQSCVATIVYIGDRPKPYNRACATHGMPFSSLAGVVAPTVHQDCYILRVNAAGSPHTLLH